MREEGLRVDVYDGGVGVGGGVEDREVDRWQWAVLGVTGEILVALHFR